MSVIEGYLTETDAKAGTTKKGRPYTSYRGQIQGTWYSFGFDKPPVAKGDYVRAEIGDVNGYQQILRSERIDPPTAQPPIKTMTGIGAPTPAAPATGFRDRNDSIVYQSSRKDAIALVELLIAQNALPVSEAKTKAGVSKRFEEIMALVDKITVQYYYDVNTLRNLERVQDAGAEGPAPQSLPEDAQEVEKEDPTAAAADNNW
jgi:hypothetical protein